jgi:uridylate kinase
MNAPFDPVASKKAESLGVRVTVLSGHNFTNLKNYFKGKKFIGTVIE